MEARVGSGTASVEAEPDGSFVLRVDGSLQSRVDLAEPTRLLFEYVRRIGDVLDLVAPPRQPIGVLHVGGAGLTLPRYVAATRPRSRQIVLEPDEDLTEFVRDTLPVPKRAGIKVRGVGGRPGIDAVRDESVDVVIVDAFVDETVPLELLTAEFVAECARVLRATGLLMFNLIDGRGLNFARRFAASVIEAFGAGVVLAERPVLSGKHFGNLVLIGSAGSVPVGELRERAGRARPPYDVRPLAELAGSARPITDADALRPPSAPAGTFGRR